MFKIYEKFDTFAFSVYLVAAGIAGAISVFFFKLAKKFFTWAGKELFKSAINETREILVTPVLDEIKKEVYSLKDGFKSLSASVERYKEEKHRLEGEHLQVVQVIIDEDHEARDALKEHYKERLKKRMENAE